MLKENQDAFGHAYVDYHNGKLNAVLMIDRDDGQSEEGGECWAYFTEYADWPPHQKKALEQVKGRVLDIGCGAGRHSLYFQQKGHDVLGIDESPLAIQVCKSRGLKNAQALSLTRISSRLGTFDTVLMLGNNFGLFGTFKRAKWMLKRLHSMTSSDALIIAETLNPTSTSDPVHLAYHERNRLRGRPAGQVRIRSRCGPYKTPWIDLLLVSKDEMKSILDGTGWQVREFLDSAGACYVAVIGKCAP